jgi:large subunit ribosomal protein L23
MNAFIVTQPIITEKTLLLANTQNTFTFQVARTATKKQIQEIIGQMYDVDVVSVNTVSGHASRVATGRRRLKTVKAKLKKAFIKLKDGQTIALFDMTGAA